MLCNNPRMSGNGSDARLRSVIAEGLTRLDSDHGGRYLSTVARHLGVERSTVSRWKQQHSTARPDHCETLARRWPRYFDRDQLLDLHFRAIQSGQAQEYGTAGLEILSDTALVLDATTAEILIDPDDPVDRIINHCSMHIDTGGRDPSDSDSMFGSELIAKFTGFRRAEAQRAAEGWTVRLVVSAGNVERLASITSAVFSLDGPNVEIHAYPHSLPLVVAPLVVANRTVFMTRDHRRWERPGAAMLLRSRAAAEWANTYFADLVADAPFTLRRPSGVDEAELARFEGALRNNGAHR